MSELVLERLFVGRGAFRAGAFDLRAGPGTLVALIGPNGGGKTTLLRTLAGLLPPRGGRLELPEAAPAALLPAPGTLSPPYTALHVVALGRAGEARWSPSLGSAARTAAIAALAALGVESLAPHPFDRLSSGQQQLVLMARLLVQDARLCLLDEPTAMLDPAQAAKVEAAIRRLAEGGRVVVFATHDIAAARRSDLVVTVGPGGAEGVTAGAVTSDLLSSLYGAEVESCPTCGNSATRTTRAA